MIRLAICDDIMRDEIHLDKYITSWMENQKIIYEKRIFTNSRSLLYEIEDGIEFDLLFLDIEMPELDGIALAEQIKKYLPEVLIIFVSSYEKYVYKSFEVQPYRFIPKKLIRQMLPGALRDAAAYIEKNSPAFYIVENQKGMEKIPLRSIYYIWHRGKYAYLEKGNGETSKVRKTLKQVFSELPSDDFVWIDRGCICNLTKISRLKGDIIYLDNGCSLPISKDRMTEIKDILLRYWTDLEN